MSSWRSWIARHRPKVKVARSSRAEDTMARFSLVREVGCNPADAGFDSRARLLTARRLKDQDSGVLNR
jgi:hypothetical protein